MASPPENLYHTLLTIINNRSNTPQTTTILSTFTSLSAAKASARKALFTKGYEKSFFTTFDVHEDNQPEGSWTHGDGLMVYAVAPEGEIFKVRVETTANEIGLVAAEESAGEISEPLWHVLQTTIYYDKDASGAERETKVQGSWRSWNEARSRAGEVLLCDGEVTKEDFAEYDERTADDEEQEWEYGEDVVVHAVGINGENVLVAVVRSGKDWQDS